MSPLLLASLFLGGADAPADAVPARKICREASAPMGSHIKRGKTCRTEAEWKEYDEAHRGAPITTKAPQREPWERDRPQ